MIKSYHKVILGLMLSSFAVVGLAENKQTEEEIYHPIHPAFVVALKTEKNKKRYIQVRFNASAKDWATVDQIKNNDPLVRDRLMMYLSRQEFENLKTMEQKKKMTSGAKDVLNTLLKEMGYPENVKEMLITEFIIE